MTTLLKYKFIFLLQKDLLKIFDNFMDLLMIKLWHNK